MTSWAARAVEKAKRGHTAPPAAEPPWLEALVRRVVDGVLTGLGVHPAAPAPTVALRTVASRPAQPNPNFQPFCQPSEPVASPSLAVATVEAGPCDPPIAPQGPASPIPADSCVCCGAPHVVSRGFCGRCYLRDRKLRLTSEAQRGGEVKPAPVAPASPDAVGLPVPSSADDGGAAPVSLVERPPQPIRAAPADRPACTGCGRPKVLARGMCSRCYNRDRQRAAEQPKEPVAAPVSYPERPLQFVRAPKAVPVQPRTSRKTFEQRFDGLFTAPLTTRRAPTDGIAVTADFAGDPPRGRSALDQREGG